jgi:TetR/AcrR family transcriptional regulator
MIVSPWRDRAITQAQSVDRSRIRSLTTVEKIVSSARALVIERAGGPFTTQELVERSGCSLQTIYRYFPSKDQLLLAVFEEAVALGTELIRTSAVGCQDPIDRFRAIVAASIPCDAPEGFEMDTTVLVSVHTRLSLLFPAEVEDAQRPYVEMIRECLQSMVDEKRIGPRQSIEEDAQLITYLIRATYQALITSRVSEDRAAVAERVATFCLSALGIRDTVRQPPPHATKE